MVVLFTLYANVSSASADEYPWKHSVAPKFLIFIPNDNDSGTMLSPNNQEYGLKDYNAGIGTGVDVRFNILSTSVFNLQLGPEWDLIMLSIKDKSTSVGFLTYDETLIFNTYKMKANVMMVFFPQSLCPFL
jgi:hypothetical protein